MKTLAKLTRKILFCAIFLVAICVIFAGSGTEFAHAYRKEASVSVTNGDFTSYQTGTKGQPYSITSNNWTVSKDSAVMMGVISVDADEFEDNNGFTLSTNPETDEAITDADNYILMFKLNRDIENLSGKGYAKSESVTLGADKFYDISVHVKTANNGQGSIYASYDGSAKFLSISTTSWRTYHFIVATDKVKDTPFDITLCYGASLQNTSSGEVFYDNIEIYEISENDFYTADETLNTIVKTNLNEERQLANIATNFINNNFENGSNSWKAGAVSGGTDARVGIYSTSIINSYLVDNFSTGVNPAKTYAYGNTSSLALINVNSATTSLSSADDNFLTVPQHSLYVLSMLVKNSGSGFSVTLTPENEDLSAVTVSTLSESIDAYNGFSKLFFYIKGSTLKDEKVSISFTLANTKGYAVVDDITLYPVTSTEFETLTSSSSDQILDLTTERADTEEITNGLFDFVELNTYTRSYPLQPKDWEFIGKDKHSGVIRINPTEFANDKANYGNPNNPRYNDKVYPTYDSEYYNENLLMLWNRSDDEIYYESNAITLSASASTVKFSVGVKTVGTARAFVKVVDSKGDVIAVIDDINTAGEWEMQHIYVTNSMTELNIRLFVGMEGHSTSEYVFFDTVSYSSSASSDLENENFLNKNVFHANLLQNDFVSHSNKTVKPNVYKNLNFSLLEKSGNTSYYGVIDSRNYANMPVYPDAISNNMLVISNPTTNYITLESIYTYSLVKDSYYEFAIWIRTYNTTLADDTAYGASFEVIGLDEDGNLLDRTDNTTCFSNILTDSTENNGWTRYAIYIKCESDQKVKVLLGLGNEENLVQGDVYVSGLTSQVITKDEYAEKESNSTTIVTSVVEKEDDKKDDPDKKTTTSSDINFFALFSSLLLVVALILAIIGYVIRKIPKKNKPKKSKKKPVYSKEATIIDKTTVARELADRRKISISEINKSLDELNAELNKLKAEYEEKSKDEEFVNTTLYKEYSTRANMFKDEIEKLESAKAYLINERAIKNIERKEVKRRQKESDKEFERLKDESDE